jgi:hypothetical protein
MALYPSLLTFEKQRDMFGYNRKREAFNIQSGETTSMLEVGKKQRPRHIQRGGLMAEPLRRFDLLAVP